MWSYVLEKSTRERVCADGLESMPKNAKDIKNIKLQGHETRNYQENRADDRNVAATAADFTLCLANICNQEQAIPSCHNDKYPNSV